MGRSRQRGRPSLTQEDHRIWAQIANRVEPLKSPRTRLLNSSAASQHYTDSVSQEPSDVLETTKQFPKGADKTLPSSPSGQDFLTELKAKGIGGGGLAHSGRQAGSGQSVGGLQAGVLHNVDRRSADRLKRGRYEIDMRLDLHGMTRDSAHGALRATIRRGRAQGARCVLVITGKGLRADGGHGVLRSEVPKWLNMADLRPHILGFSRAQPQHGGDGALYVLLKRVRS